MKWLFAALLLIEIVAVLVAGRLVPHVSRGNEAALVAAVNGIVLIVVAKRLKKKPACCS